MARDALGFIGSFFGSFSIIFGGLSWIIMREVAIQQSASELRTSKEMAVSELRTSKEIAASAKEMAASELRTSKETAASKIDMLTRLLDMQHHGDYASWRGEYY